MSRPRGALRGIAADGRGIFALLAVDAATEVDAYRTATQRAWRRDLAGRPTAIGRTGDAVVVGIATDGPSGPGAAVTALDAATGSPRWQLGLPANQWALITAVASYGADAIIGGTFSGTLRAGSRVVTSAGKTDGFVARLTNSGEVAWLIRVGGANADGVFGVAATANRLAITGSFTAGAELLGEPLVAADDRSLRSDVFVAELTGDGKRLWSASFGGKLDDSPAGIAIDGKGRIAVAATVRDSLHINVADIKVDGESDALTTYFAPDGTAGPTVVFGGPGADAARAIAAVGERIVVGGQFTRTLRAGRDAITASGGDDAFIAVLEHGQVASLAAAGGPGREELVGLVGQPGGFIAALAHTAGLTLAGARVAAPADPMTGGAIISRALE